MQKVKEDGIIAIEEVKQFDKLIAEFNKKILELKFKQTKKDEREFKLCDYNMILSMSQSGSRMTVSSCWHYFFSTESS